jgi:hypothetical protein
VTGKGSPLDNPSEYLISFYMYDYIGGRFSVTSMVRQPLLAFLSFFFLAYTARIHAGRFIRALICTDFFFLGGRTYAGVRAGL